MNNDILEKAETILKERAYKEVCRKAGICHCCGGKLQEPKPIKKSFLGFIYYVEK